MESPCWHCGASIHTYPSRLAEARDRFCSKACLYAARRAAALDPILMASRFWSHVERLIRPGCWDWLASCEGGGYGQFVLHAGANTKAHHVAWFLATGHWPASGECVLHTCDNRGCVRNDEPGVYRVNGHELPRFGHLALGTVADNNADMRAKGRDNRTARARGEQHGGAKLTDAQVAAIRSAYAAGGVTQRALASHYGVCQGTISHILLGRSTGNRRYRVSAPL